MELTIIGEPASKANSRRLVRYGGVSRLIKSDKALRYTEAFNKQCPVLPVLMEGDLGIELVIYYSSRRPDLDESLILDLLQGKIYANDRQIKAKRVVHRLDKDQPRCLIRVSALASCDYAGDL